MIVRMGATVIFFFNFGLSVLSVEACSFFVEMGTGIKGSNATDYSIFETTVFIRLLVGSGDEFSSVLFLFLMLFLLKTFFATASRLWYLAIT